MEPSKRWIDATPSRDAAEPIDAEQIASWRERGFAFVSGVFPDALIADLVRSADGRFPAAGSPEAEEVADFGSGGRLTFPAMSRSFNAVTLHPRLLRTLSLLLDVPVEELRLTQSDLWPKFGRAQRKGAFDNADQRIHVDYPNHTLTHPPAWHRPEAVELILYLDDVADCGGPTAVVPRTGPDDEAYRWPIVDSPGIGALDYVNDRASAERYLETERPEIVPWRARLYERERHVRYRAGDLLLYRHDTWHRGTPMKEGARRLVHNMTFRRRDAEWISTLHVGWSWSMYHPNKFIERLIAEASVAQRCVLGFPAPGSHYWTSETLDAVEARYGAFGIDMAPYREAAGA